MPRRDGTGPMGFRSITGRGLGLCAGANALRCDGGFGMELEFAYRRGFSRGFAVNKISTKTQEELLQEQKDMLQNRLEVIDKQLESL